jgi:hypothetical protein
MLFDKISKAHRAQNLSCFGQGVGVWFIAWPIFTTFQFFSLFFSTTFCTWLGLPHPSIVSFLPCACTHPIDPMGIHLLHCSHGNEHTSTHVVICNTFAIVAQDISFHLGQKQLHAFLSTTFNSSCWWINIVFTIDEIHILVDIIIANPMQTDLLPWSYTIQRFVTFNATQAKEKNYRNQHPTK